MESTSVEELKRQLEEAKRVTERERQRADEAKQRADEAERQRREAQQRREASEQQIRPTTLDEYLAACHSSLYSNFNIEQNPKLTSKGPIPNPRNKWCPTNLRPWPDFIQQQRITFGTLYDTFPADRRVFENRGFLAGLGNRISKRKIADEKTLEYFLHNTVEDPVRVITDQLKEVEEVRTAFHLGNGIIFENHPHAISELSEEVIHREAPSTPPSTPNHRLDLNQLRPDQICIYRSDDVGSELRTMVYVSEYKPPHKLTAPHLRLGLHPMNIYQDVVNRKTIPTSIDPDALFQYHADRLTAAAITQTYHYMIEGGLEYGLLTTGEAIVFLKVDWQDPGTLFYHLAEPDAEVSAQPRYSHLCTAVAQYLAFSLMALGSPGEGRLHGQDERRRATESLKTWMQDFETTRRSIPEDERCAPPSSPGYRPEAHESVDRSPYLLRGKRRRVGDDLVKEQGQRDPGESSDDDDDDSPPKFPDTPSPTERRTRQGTQEPRRSQRILAQRPRGGRGGGEGGEGERGGHEQDRPFCTQRCLLGLVNGGFLDPRCPNVAYHRKQPDNHCSDRRTQSRTHTRHPISHARFLELLKEQLERTLDDGITPTGQFGARGVLFTVTLLAYGYTFVSKGTIRAFVQDLEHEAAVYKRLQPIQGMHVPVLLGSIDLRSMNRIYYYDHRVYVIYMMFLSWGGLCLGSTGTPDVTEEQLRGKAMQSLRAMHQQGVAHKDVRWLNMLFNAEVNGVMMIDFERALLLESPRRPLARLVPNKRRREPGTSCSKSEEKSSGQGQMGRAFSNDISMMEMAFYERRVD